MTLTDCTVIEGSLGTCLPIKLQKEFGTDCIHAILRCSTSHLPSCFFKAIIRTNTKDWLNTTSRLRPQVRKCPGE